MEAGLITFLEGCDSVIVGHLDLGARLEQRIYQHLLWYNAHNRH
jgi:hypothetical protein